MIQEFVDRFMANRSQLESIFSAVHPGYADIVREVVSVIADPDGYEQPDAKRITVIDHGDYQGTMLFVIASSDYQPSTFWFVKMSYGSCSYCDTVQGIREMSDEISPTPEQTKEYMTIALHVVQGIKLME